MSDAPLLPCPSCSRHVRASEGTCPFCAAALPASFARAALPRSPAGRLSRAALFALGTSAAALAACSAVHPVYGGPPADIDAAPPGDGGTDGPPLLVDAAYGGPPRDAASDANDGAPDASDDASSEPDGGAAPAYGAPP